MLCLSSTCLCLSKLRLAVGVMAVCMNGQVILAELTDIGWTALLDRE